ncbi:MAG: hypothetical protein LBB79_02015 [Prevotellaceae bacterium]|jgi:uncharacterized lipoprotein NlpE involved in copper resistance|nr:hypothetical protein [Prevotellaceae bacterium]
MKKKIFSAMALTAVLMGASCAKEDPAKPVDYSAPEKQATVTGKLVINENLTLSPQKYTAKEGITVIASVRYSSLNPSSSSSGAFSTSTTTNSKGEFTLTVPATEAGVSVSFAVNDIEGSQTTSDTNKPKLPGGGYPTKVEQGKWSFDVPSKNVQSGQKVILESVVGTFSQLDSAGDDV